MISSVIAFLAVVFAQLAAPPPAHPPSPSDIRVRGILLERSESSATFLVLVENKAFRVSRPCGSMSTLANHSVRWTPPGSG